MNEDPGLDPNQLAACVGAQYRLDVVSVARPVTPREEDLFFAGYGPMAVDPPASAYFRYERIVEDLGEFGRRVFLSPALSEEARAREAELAMSFFAPGADIDRVENVASRRPGTVSG